MKKDKILSLILCLMILMGALNSCAIFGSSGSSGGAGSDSEAAENIISKEEAMNIALSRVDGATENDFTRFEIEQDEGHWIYIGEIIYKGIEYDFEIEACNGNILIWEIDN